MGVTPQPGTPFIPYAVPRYNARPPAATVIAITGIIYASLGLLSGLAGLVSSAFMLLGTGMQVPGMVPAQYQWTVVFSVGGLMLAGVLLAGSIGAIRMRRWGRRWMIRWTWPYLAFQVLTAVIQVGVVAPQVMASLATASGPGAPPFAMEPILYASAAIGFLVSAAFPICVLVFMTRPHVRAAFEQQGPHLTPEVRP